MTKATTAYLRPILRAAKLLQLRPFQGQVNQLTAVLDRLNPAYPQDTLPRLEALRAVTLPLGCGTVEELDILDKVWPDWSGNVRYRMTATTLTWQWSAKHSSRYATITVPFPTLMPMRIEVVRYCDMDDEANHADGCDEGDCNCEASIEQTVTATVTEWDDVVESELWAWLRQAVIEPVEAATFPQEA